MFPELTELLTCPRCGPAQSLILLVESSEVGRVLEGRLGCPTCHTDYIIRNGVAHLGSAETEGRPSYEEEELPVKIAALSGLTEGPGFLLLGPGLGHLVGRLGELIHDVEIISIEPTSGDAPPPGVSRIVSTNTYPIVPYRLRAVVLVSSDDAASVSEAAKLVAVGGRLVLFDAGDADVSAAERAGLRIAARQERTVVAQRGD